MKHRFLIPAVLVLLSATLQLKAQSVSGMVEVAHYSLIGSASDIVGENGDLDLQNTRYASDSGLWTNGIYIHDTIPGGSLMRTPIINNLNTDTLALSAEIYVPAFDDRLHPILVAGEGWRYLGCGYSRDGGLHLIVNGISYSTEGTILTAGEWHTILVTYYAADSAITFYLDGTKIQEVNTTLFAPADDWSISNTHFGWGATFLGYMRNMRIWGPPGPASSVEELHNTPFHLDLAGGI